MTGVADVEGGSWIDAAGVRTHYHDAGEGSPVILLHGSGPGVSAWANWGGVLPSLAGRHRAIAIDLAGFGGSDKPLDVTYGVALWAGQVREVLARLEIERASFVGNSMGGRVALQIALDAPGTVDRLVLMGAAGLLARPTPALSAIRDYAPSRQAMRELLAGCFVHDPSLVSEEVVETRFRASEAPGAHEAYRRMFDAAGSADDMLLSDAELGSVTCPTLVVHGREDKVVPVANGLRMAELIPGADLLVLGRCGHWTQVERATAFTAAVLDFLSRS
ncbi:alpha/beta fold hydrolase [Pseudonocardia acaciae]|uniref:alpha/beta fold hydrolase n=1 Tax=Pseudonocardia acaciae TaxID=551276 RepID=UPI0004914CCB|nr:alpha/beta hydrolase [Pseudonocardia acaciae]